jgi:hypothetical protein
LNRGALQQAVQHRLDLSTDIDVPDVPVFDSIDDVKAYTWRGDNYGMEAASTVISALRDPRPDLRVHQNMVQAAVATTIRTTQALEHILRDVAPERLYVLNGRRASQMGAVRAARRVGTPLFTYEIGHDTENGFVLIPETYFHDLDAFRQQILCFWDRLEDKEKGWQIGSSFFTDRRYGTGGQFIEAQFTDQQESGRLPEGFDPESQNIAVFNSSEDEFAAVDGYQNPVYADQIAALPQILEDPCLDANLTFYLRVHPNLKGVDNHQIREIRKLTHPNIRVIPPESDVDTYALMDACDRVLTFGSTMGIESAFFGKPSIVVGQVPFGHLGSVYVPNSHEAVIDLLNDSDLPTLDRLGAVQFGYYMVARDHPFRHTETDGVASSDILGPSPLARYGHMAVTQGPLYLLRYWVRRALAHMKAQRRDAPPEEGEQIDHAPTRPDVLLHDGDPPRLGKRLSRDP